MCRVFPGSEYYGGSAPPAPSAGVAPIPGLPPGGRKASWNGRGWFPRSRLPGRRVRHPAIPLRHRHGYCRRQFAVASRPRQWRSCPEFPARDEERVRTATQPESAGLELVRVSRGVTEPVSRVCLPVLLTAPGPSGSAEPARLCRGCSHPPRRPPDQAASSFTPPLRRQGNGRSFTSIRNNRASWRTQRYSRTCFARSSGELKDVQQKLRDAHAAWMDLAPGFAGNRRGPGARRQFRAAVALTGCSASRLSRGCRTPRPGGGGRRRWRGLR